MHAPCGISNLYQNSFVVAAMKNKILLHSHLLHTLFTTVAHACSRYTPALHATGWDGAFFAGLLGLHCCSSVTQT